MVFSPLYENSDSPRSAGQERGRRNRFAIRCFFAVGHKQAPLEDLRGVRPTYRRSPAIGPHRLMKNTEIIMPRRHTGAIFVQRPS